MTTHASPDTYLEALESLIERAETLSTEYGEEVATAVADLEHTRLGDEEARHLFVQVLTVLRDADDSPDHAARAAVAARIRELADELVTSRHRPSGSARTAGSVEVRGGLTFHHRNGLRPRPVVPVQSFNGVGVELTEGYVDVTTLTLWQENERLTLQVQEFIDNNGRAPEPNELMELMHDRDDPFNLKPLAESIGRKGVERPPILTWSGDPKDGNRRIAASLLVLADPKAPAAAKEKARWIRVWQAAEGTTDDQFDAIVVALNFESDHKEDWPEYVKARIVAKRHQALRANSPKAWNAADIATANKQIAEEYAIKPADVKRYLEMVKWADDFEDYHVNERNLVPADVRYKANEAFQWFYEIQAGKKPDKIIGKLEQDDDLRSLAYDLMYDVFDSGVQVRNLHKIVVDDAALQLLKEAHAEPDPKEGLKLVNAAVAEALKNGPTKKLGFEQFLRNAVDRLDNAPPNHWRAVDDALLDDLRRVFHSAVGTIQAEQAVRAGSALPTDS